MADMRLIRLGMIISAFLLCSHFSSQTSTDGRELPTTNVWGILTDTTNHSYRVENITIASRFSDIAVYQKPTSPNINPDINTTRLNLCEIAQLRVESPNVLEYNKRDYIEITVISNDKRGTRNNYLIEKSKKLFCDEVNAAGPIEKELSFLAVRQLQIQGCKKQDDDDKNCWQRPEEQRNHNNQPILNQQAVDLTITKTKSLIQELETVAGKLPNDQQEGTIKSQILQLLDDLKSSFKNWFA